MCRRPLCPFFLAEVVFYLSPPTAAVLRRFGGYTGLPIFPHIGLKQPQNVGKVFPSGENEAVLPEIAVVIFPHFFALDVSLGKNRGNSWDAFFPTVGKNVLPPAVSFFRACICPAGAPLRGIAGRKKIGPERRTVPGFFLSGHKPLCGRQARTRF